MLSKLDTGMRGRSRGFNLIELMITLLVIAILMSLAYPAYQGRVIQARRADGHRLLYEAAQRQQQHFTEYGFYTKYIDTEPDGIKGLRMKQDSQEGYYRLSSDFIDEDNTTYTLTATALSPQTADTECGDLTLTHLNVKDCSATDCDVNRCW